MKRQFDQGRRAPPRVPEMNQDEDHMPTMNVWLSPYKAHIPHLSTAAVEKEGMHK